MQKKLWFEKRKEVKVLERKKHSSISKKYTTNGFSGFWVQWGKLAEATLLQQTKNEYLLCVLKVAMSIFFLWGKYCWSESKPCICVTYNLKILILKGL